MNTKNLITIRLMMIVIVLMSFALLIWLIIKMFFKSGYNATASAVKREVPYFIPVCKAVWSGKPAASALPSNTQEEA